MAERPPAPQEHRVQELDGLRKRLWGLHATLGSWRAVAARFEGVPAGTLCAVAHGREPRRTHREALGLPPVLRIKVGQGIFVASGAVVLRDSRPCACGCGQQFVPNAWNHAYLPGHRRRR